MICEILFINNVCQVIDDTDTLNDVSSYDIIRRGWLNDVSSYDIIRRGRFND
jgi:hypothetical protein